MIELNKIYNENCLNTMKKIKDSSIDMVLTSPPYDNLRKYTKDYMWNFKIFQEVAKELYRIIKQGGVIVWNVNDATINGSETCSSFRQALYFNEIGFKLHDTMIFLKTNPPPLNHNRYDPSFEYMFILSKGKPKTFNPILEKCKHFNKKINRASNKKALNEPKYAVRYRNENTQINKYKYRKNVWNYTVGNNGKNPHVAPFPLQLAKDHIYSWSNKNDIIYDPFIGSGTTCLAAKQLNRNFLGSEISREYCKYIQNKLKYF